MRRILATASVLALGLALAQDAGIPPNLAEWFAEQVLAGDILWPEPPKL